MLGKKEYTLRNELEGQNDEVVIQELMNRDSSQCICDEMSEVSDNNVSIYTQDILNVVGGLYNSGAYDEAREQGMLSANGDLIEDLQGAWFEYNSGVLYENMQYILYNYGVDYLNNTYGDRKFTSEELEIFIERYEEELCMVDTYNSFDDVSEIVDIVVSEM